MSELTSPISRVLFVASFVLAGLAVCEKLANLFGYTVLQEAYQPWRLLEFAAIALLFVVRAAAPRNPPCTADEGPRVGPKRQSLKLVIDRRSDSLATCLVQTAGVCQTSTVQSLDTLAVKPSSTLSFLSACQCERRRAVLLRR